MGRSQTFQWFSRFKAGRTSIDDDERSGRPVYSSTPEMIESASKTGSAAGIVVKPQKGTTLKVTPAPNV